MKIAVVPPPLLQTPPRAYGGLEIVVADLCEALAKYGHDVTLYAPRGSHAEGCKVFETIVAKETTQCNWVQEEVAAFNAYAANMVTQNFDIVHDHTWFGTAYLAKASKADLKVCHTHHGHLDWNPKARPANTTHLNLIGISKHMCSLYKKAGHDSRYAYNGINLDKYPFSAEKGDRLIYVGRFSSFKMPHIAIDLARDTGHQIDLVGGSFVAPDEMPYLNYVKMRCINGEGIMHLDAPHEKKIELLQKAKACIVPSRFMEPFGLVAAEAMACGTPVIALNDGALGEVVGTDGKSGVVCDDYESLMRAVKEIDKISPNACRKRAEMFSRDETVKKNLELYKDVIEGREW